MKKIWDYRKPFINLMIENNIGYYTKDKGDNIILYLKDKSNNNWVEIVYEDDFINIGTYIELPLEYKSCDNTRKIIQTMRGENKID